MDSIKVSVTTDPIELGGIIQDLADPRHGAMNVFVGMVRSLNLGRDVVAVEYDCFIPLCEKVFREIALEARQTWANDANIFIQHRHGRLVVGEASVAIVATTGHRDESYRITRYIIEEIKTRAPIWKKEYYQDGKQNG